MKLRNKKTGEIIDLAKEGFLESDTDNHIIVYPEGTLKYYAYNSLAELNEEWEDYASPEPLIKDEKIRKAVRAWAEANGDTKIKATSDMLQFWGKKSLLLEFDGEIGNGDIETYTIAELCGKDKNERT